MKNPFFKEQPRVEADSSEKKDETDTEKNLPFVKVMLLNSLVRSLATGAKSSRPPAENHYVSSKLAASLSSERY